MQICGNKSKIICEPHSPQYLRTVLGRGQRARSGLELTPSGGLNWNIVALKKKMIAHRTLKISGIHTKNINDKYTKKAEYNIQNMLKSVDNTRTESKKDLFQRSISGAETGEPLAFAASTVALVDLASSFAASAHPRNVFFQSSGVVLNNLKLSPSSLIICEFESLG